jgi:hypothetical protein
LVEAKSTSSFLKTENFLVYLEEEARATLFGFVWFVSQLILNQQAQHRVVGDDLRKTAPKLVCVLFVACMFCVFLLGTGVFSQTIQKPAVPEFTIQQVDRSYDVAPVYGTDPYTGKTELIREGYHVNNRTIDVTINNQPFTPTNIDGNTTELYIRVSSKGHFERWEDLYKYGDQNKGSFVPQDSSSDVTVVTFVLGTLGWEVENGDMVDFQVSAVVGYHYLVLEHLIPIRYFQELVASEWSSTQTITIGSNVVVETPTSPTPIPSTLPSQTPTETPQTPINSGSLLNLTPEQTALAIAFAAIAVLVIALVVMWRKKATKK